MDLNIPNFKTNKELFDFIVENEKDLHWAKKQAFKKADAISLAVPTLKSFNQKSQSISDLLSKDSIEVVSIINTTKLLDSYDDVHIDGLWDKSLLENKLIKHLQEHQMKFDMIIADKEDLEAYTEEFSWKGLGYNAPGKTQALTFKSVIRKDRNPFMFEQYAKGNVDQHSVGMRYVKLLTCINDEDYPVQKENYDKYAPMVVNLESARNKDFFWAVTEAKCIEGSAVPLGANSITPTQSVKSMDVNFQEIKPKSAYLSWLEDL